MPFGVLHFPYFSPPEAFGGINENFVQSVAPTSVRGPAPDAELPVSRTLVIFAANVDSAKQIAAEIVYDPAVFGNFTFVGGNLVTGALILPAGGVAEPEIREDGLASVSASGAKLQGRGLSAGDTPKRVFVVPAADEFLVEAPSALPGDFDGNNTVNFNDFFLFVDRFGETTSSPDFDSQIRSG